MLLQSPAWWPLYPSSNPKGPGEERIQFQNEDEGLPGLKLVQQPSDQWVAERGQDISLLVRLGPSSAPQGDELGSTEYLISFVLYPFYKAKHASGEEGGGSGW